MIVGGGGWQDARMSIITNNYNNNGDDSSLLILNAYQVQDNVLHALQALTCLLLTTTLCSRPY